MNTNISFCHACKYKSAEQASGIKVCEALLEEDRQSIAEHVRRGFCPHPDAALFGTGEKPAEWGQLPKPQLQPAPPRQFSDEEQELLREIDAAANADRGLGDTVHRYLKRVGADKAAELFTKITGINCRCEKRRAWLNKWWPYKPTSAA